MGSRLLWGLVIVTILLQVCSVCWCKVTVSVQFISYRNTHAKDHAGDPCDPRWGRDGQCDPFFEICIDKITRHGPNPADWVRNCEYKKAITGWYHDQNEVTFDHDMRTVSNPINVDIEDTEEGVAVRVRVQDHDEGILRGNPDIVDYLEFDYLIEEDNGLFKTRDSAKPYRQLIRGTRTTAVPTSLTIDFRAYCAEDYYMYQGQCTRYCKKGRSDKHGRLLCTQDGLQCFKSLDDKDTNCTSIDDRSNNLPNLAPQTGGGDGNGVSNGVIIGVVLGIFFLILIIVIVIALLVRERRKRQLKEQGTSTAVSTHTMGAQTHPGTTDMGTGGSYANPAFSHDSSMQTDNLRNQRAAAAHGTQTANGHGVKVMEAGLMSPPPYKVADLPTGGSASFHNHTYGDQQVGAVGGAGGSVEHTYDEVGLNKKY